MKYRTLAQLVAAVKAGRATGVLAVGNDDTFLYDGDPGEEECVFRMDPGELLEQALDLLGIAHEGV